MKQEKLQRAKQIEDLINRIDAFMPISVDSIYFFDSMGQKSYTFNIEEPQSLSGTSMTKLIHDLGMTAYAESLGRLMLVSFRDLLAGMKEQLQSEMEEL